MKKDSFVLNFLLGVILMILLAVAARAQSKPPADPKKFNTDTVKKKTVTAEEAKDLYEEQYGKQEPGKRNSYSRKDIDSRIPVLTNMEIVNNNNKSLNTPADSVQENTQSSQSNEKREPKAIYKGAQKTMYSNVPVTTTKKEPTFIEHIEINIGPGND